MNLTVDIGNTRTKAALFENGKLERYWYKATPALLQTVRPYLKNVIVSSVGENTGKEWERFAPNARFWQLSAQTPLPFANRYATPETLGIDRIAAITGAYALHPNADCLVIDAGTCITFDLLDAKKGYLGGSISVGLHIRAKALHTFTARLPLLEDLDRTPLIGNDTKTCIASGIVNGAVAEIEGIITRYKQEYPHLQVLMCGGDASFFERQINIPIFVASDLVHIGLNKILEHNNAE